MTIENAYKISLADEQTRTARSGYTPDQTRQISEWTTRIAAAAAFLGWQCPLTEDIEDIEQRLRVTISDRHELQKHLHTFEICKEIINLGRVLFEQI